MVIGTQLKFPLDGGKTWLHKGIVKPIFCSAQALSHTGSCQGTSICLACMQAAAVCMVDQVNRWLTNGSRLPLHAQNLLFLHMILQIPSDDTMRVKIHQDHHVPGTTSL